MRQRLISSLAPLVAVAAFTLAPGRASACGGGGALMGGIIAGGILGGGLAITDLVFLGNDIAKASDGKQIKPGLAIAEVVLAVPQVIGSLVVTGFGGAVNAAAIYGTGLAWAALAIPMLAHGAWTLTHPAEPEPAASAARVRLVPSVAMEHGGVNCGLAAVGRF
jgi:hypothetical protein